MNITINLCRAENDNTNVENMNSSSGAYCLAVQ